MENRKRQIQRFLVGSFDLSNGEAETYLKLVETQPTTVLELAKAAGINRITVHGYIEKLIEKGLVSQIKHGARRKLKIENPKKLKKILEEQKKELKDTEEKLPNIITTLTQLVPDAKKDTTIEVKYYDGKETVFNIYKESMKANEVFSFAHLDRYYEIFPDTRDLWRQSMKTNPKRKVWDILLDSPLDRKIRMQTRNSRYQAKILPHSKHFSGFKFADYLIFHNTVAIILLDPKHTHATLIRSKHVALSLKALHQSLWELLPG